MSNPDFNYTVFGTQGTSTGAVQLRTGPCLLHTINVLSSGTGSVAFYDGTTSSTSNLIGVINPGITNSFRLDVVLTNGLLRGNTTSTAEMNVTWA